MRTRREKPRRARKPPAGIPALLPRFRRGELTEEQFYRATSADFDRMALALMRPYRRTSADGGCYYELPASIDALDVAQELRLLVLKAVESWDAARGCDLAKFAVFKAMGRASRKLQQERKARRVDKNQGSEPSRYPLLLIDACEREEREAMLSSTLWQAEPPPAADEAADEQHRHRAAQLLAASLGTTVEELASRIKPRAEDQPDGCLPLAKLARLVSANQVTEELSLKSRAKETMNLRPRALSFRSLVLSKFAEMTEGALQ